VTPAVAGADTGRRTLAEADADVAAVVRLLVEAGLPGAVVATHLTRTGGPHVTLSLEVPGADPARLLAQALPGADVGEAAAAGAQAHAARRSGRLVHFPGVEQLVGTLSVAALLERSAVERVHVLGGTGEPGGDVLVRTREHVRPAYGAGRVVLAAEWAAGRVLVPFEVPVPTPCCADHG
jgi:hypothetical protein